MPGRRFLLWTLAVLAWLGFTAGLRPLHLPDEARYVGVAWEMLGSGDWLTPMLNAAPFFHKPPLFYWITAATLSAGDSGEWGARVAPWVAASGCAMVSAWFVSRWLGWRSAQAALLALATQPLYFVAAQFANLDMLVAACIGITIWLLAHSALLLERGEAARRPLVLAYGMAGLGVLAKGLIGVALPGLVIVVWLSLRQQWRVLFRLMWCPMGLALFLVVTVPWFWLMQQRFDDFLNYFFIVHHVKRFAAEGFNNAQPWFFYPALLLALSLPLWPWLWRALAPSYWRDTQRGAVRQLLWLWLLLVTLFFSLPLSKPLGYILPVLPPLAVLAADVYAGLAAPGRWARRWWYGGVALSAALGLGVVAFYTVQPHTSSRQLGLALGQRWANGEPVVALHRFPYDVPFYARLPQPMVVVQSWQDPEVRRSDSWPKELVEAERFLPRSVPTRLIEPTALPSALCDHRISWLIGHPSEAQRYPVLAAAEEVFADTNSALWRLDRDATSTRHLLICPAP